MPKVVVAVGAKELNQKWMQAFSERNPSWSLVSWVQGEPNVEADYAVVWHTPAEFFQNTNNLKAVFNLGAGVDALKLPSASSELPLYRVEDAGMAHQMAEYAVYGVLLATQRFIPYVQSQAQKQWKKQAPVYREQYPIGIMGLGVIGTQVFESLRALGYPIRVWTRSARELAGVQTYSGKEEFSDFLQNTRILINVLPLTDETQGVLNANTFKQLLPEAFLINMARGGHLVDEDLLDALNNKQLTGALLDVFSVEPLASDHPFWDHSAIHITPHISGMTLIPETVNQISEKITALENGDTVSGLVKANLGY